MNTELTATVNGVRLEESIDNLLFDALQEGITPESTSTAQCELYYLFPFRALALVEACEYVWRICIRLRVFLSRADETDSSIPTVIFPSGGPNGGQEFGSNTFSELVVVGDITKPSEFCVTKVSGFALVRLRRR